MDGQPQQGQQEGQQPWEPQEWEPQEWHRLWQEWEGQWQVLWLQWQAQWERVFQQWQLELPERWHHPLQEQHQHLQQPLQQPWHHQHQHLQQPLHRQQHHRYQLGQLQPQWQMWRQYWNEQFDIWKKHWQQQWAEWQMRQQQDRHSWMQHQQQWLRWLQQWQFQSQMWQQQQEWHWQHWQVHQWQPQFHAWQKEWNGQWRLWQEQWLLEQQQWQHLERQRWQQEQQLWNAQKLLWQTKSINFVRLSEVLRHKPLTRPFNCDGIEMIEKTAFGRFVADGYVNELSEAHAQNLSFAGSFSESDLYVSEDESFVSIGIEPTEEATKHNKFLDFYQLTIVLLHKYIDRSQRMPPYLQEFLDRVAGLLDKTGRDLLISLWILKNHPFLMDPETWRVIVEEYYKWYKATDRDLRGNLLRKTNSNICKNWHLVTVRKNNRLFRVYWDGRMGQIPDNYYERVDFTIPLDEDFDYEIYQYTGEDAYLAVFQRVVYVHGIEILQEDLSLKELAYLIAHFFDSFLPRFIERVFIFANGHEDIPANERKLLEEVLLTYTKRRSCSWRQSQRRLYQVEETPFLHI